MKPIWIEPELWEDYQNGMYESRKNEEVIEMCVGYLTSTYILQEMVWTTREWPNSTSVNLSKRVWNNLAWLGQATCCRLFGATITEVGSAWARLTKEEREEANFEALKAIEVWKSENL